MSMNKIEIYCTEQAQKKIKAAQLGIKILK